VSSPRDNPCFDIDSNAAALNVLADDGASYLLPYAQFLSTERVPNPDLERESEAAPEKLMIHFAQAEVCILGSGLKALERALQKLELRFVKAADRRLTATLNTHVTAVTVTLAKENV
jgi:hypothetical protein